MQIRRRKRRDRRIGGDPARLVRCFVLLTWAVAVAWLSWIATSLSSMPSSDGDGASRPVAPPPPRKIRAGDLGDASHRRGAEPSSGAGRRQASKKHKKRLESQDEGAKDVPRDRAGDGDASAARRRPKPPEVEAKPPKAEGDDDYERLRRAARAAKVAKSEPSAAKDLPEAADEKERDMSVARDIPGEFLIVPKPAKGKEDDGPIRVVLGMHHVATPVRGLVLLLHDCGGSAFDFFARGDRCEECLGLSEEMRTARLVLLNGYLPMAVSSADAQSGCWSAEDDADRFRTVLALEDLGGYHIGAYAARSVVAIGAGRGGAFAAELARNELTEFALVIASGLDDGAAEELAGRTVQVPIYYAPMPNDYGTMSRVEATYARMNRNARYDQTSCLPRPVTSDYLVERVVGMNASDAGELIDRLAMRGHVSRGRAPILVRDPSASDWRGVLTRGTGNATHWLGRYPLEGGRSPLAKALSRCWAFREFCSEAVEPALRFFESFRKV